VNHRYYYPLRTLFYHQIVLLPLVSVNVLHHLNLSQWLFPLQTPKKKSPRKQEKQENHSTLSSKRRNRQQIIAERRKQRLLAVRELFFNTYHEQVQIHATCLNQARHHYHSELRWYPPNCPNHNKRSKKGNHQAKKQSRFDKLLSKKNHKRSKNSPNQSPQSSPSPLLESQRIDSKSPSSNPRPENGLPTTTPSLTASHSYSSSRLLLDARDLIGNFIAKQAARINKRVDLY